MEFWYRGDDSSSLRIYEPEQTEADHNNNKGQKMLPCSFRWTELKTTTVTNRIINDNVQVGKHGIVITRRRDDISIWQICDTHEHPPQPPTPPHPKKKNPRMTHRRWRTPETTKKNYININMTRMTRRWPPEEDTPNHKPRWLTDDGEPLQEQQLH